MGFVSLRKSKIGFLNPKESENGFCVPLLNRSIQDLSGHVVRQRNRRIHFQSGFFGSFDAPWSEISWINPSSKETQNPFSDSFGFKNPIEGCSYASSRSTIVFNLPYICLYIFSREPRVGVCLPRQIYRQMYRKSEKLTGSLLAKLHPSNLVNAIFNLVF